MLRRDSLRQVALAGLGAAAAPGPPTTAPAGPPAAGEPRGARPGWSIYGGPGLRHFDDVNPTPPRDGDAPLSALGPCDTLNPFVIEGVPAAGIGDVFEAFTVPALDEPDAPPFVRERRP